MNLEKLKWWKWSLWLRLGGQALLIGGVWIFVSAGGSGHMTRGQLLPWLGTGLGVYLLGRGLQIAAKSRSKRLAAEAKAKAKEAE